MLEGASRLAILLKAGGAALVVALFHTAPHAAVARRSFSLQDRIEALRAIETVYWRHREWPSSNPGSKPPLSLTDSAARHQVLDGLRMSAALETIWQRPIEGPEIQSELDRMATRSRAPGMLAEIVTALGDDPQWVAEALVRPSLVRQVLLASYARDRGLHAGAREQAERSLAATRRPSDLRPLAAAYQEIVWELRDADAGESGSSEGDRSVVQVDQGQWDRLLNELAIAIDHRTRSAAGWVSVGRAGDLEESDDRFFARALLAVEPRRMTVAIFSWHKTPFQSWWEETWPKFTPSLEPVLFDYRIDTSASATCPEDTWSPIDTPNGAPKHYARQNHSAVWTGAEMIVWGGDGSEGPLSSGARYDPATDTWSDVGVDAGTPSPRARHTAVWTGQEMIVWGGQASPGLYLGTGGRYDPAADEWTPMAVDSGTPSPRAYHASVWTGTEMIVWGGRVTTQSTYSKTGGRYDPQSDTWTATRADSTAPSERWRHTMVWTGTEAIVWGGAGPPNDCAQPKRWNNGGHYNPETDTWTSTTGPSVSPPLQGRTDHSAVWTGSEMIVWGGETLDTSGCLIVEQVYLRTGARYNPATKQWVATRYDTTTPTERALHTAVWTGALMIIWGGSTDGFRPNAPGGGQYDPITDTWIPMAFVTPSTRLGHSAVSTGTEMIIWGGSDNSGARYCPCSGSVYFGDSDGDGYGDPTTQVLSCTQPPGYVVNGDDCSDGNGAAWSVPSEARDLVLLDSASLEWSPPLAPGGTALVYDVLRSTIPSDFMDAAACIASDSIATTAFDASVPPEGSAYFYLVRAANDCPGGESPTGTDSEGQPIAGRSCP